MKDIMPVKRLRLYDLLREAGIDVSDWANYKRAKYPAANPRCYNWAFEGSDKVVLCLWYPEMKLNNMGVFQVQNYRVIASGLRGSQRKRAEVMDRAIRNAKDKRLPIRVIVVDGKITPGAASKVQRRHLDPLPWFVAEYKKDGYCRLQRGKLATPGETGGRGANARIRLLTRITHNTEGWRRPGGDRGEAAGSYSTENGFGHEEWLFRSEWQIDGWRYAFIEGFNRGGRRYQGHPLEVTLFTRQPDKQHRLVATIYDLECLDAEQSNDALAIFRSNGWLKTMENEIRAVGGNVGAFGDPKWAHHVLYVRYRLENLEPCAPDTILPDTKWFRDRHRYLLYDFDETERNRLDQSLRGRPGSPELPEPRQLFRRGTKSVQCDPIHDRMQACLMKELRAEYGAEHVRREQDFVDVRVETEKDLIFFEIKSDLDPRTVLRQALGQILEYAFHPSRVGRRPNQLVIVGRAALAGEDAAYLQHLRESFRLPLTYRFVAA